MSCLEKKLHGGLAIRCKFHVVADLEGRSLTSHRIPLPVPKLSRPRARVSRIASCSASRWVGECLA